MIISIIVAYAKNRCIGKNNQLPWHLPADLAHFKKITMGKPILMGRKTFESIGKPLPGRRNIVISRNKTFSGCETFRSIDAALQALKTENEIMIIGGADIFTQTLSLADRIYATEVDTIIDGDAFFPLFDRSVWALVSEEKHLPDAKNKYTHVFQLFER